MSEDASLIRQLTASFEGLSSDVVFVHSNVLNGLSVPRPEPFDRTTFLASHVERIGELVGTAALWFPAFCYDFTTTGVYDQRNDACQVGHLAEYFRVHVAEWRTGVPVFSASGTGAEPKLSTHSPLDAFGTGSVFEALHARDAAFFNYGCDLSSLTYLHYCETLANCPYRYRKQFDGRIIDMTGTPRNVRVGFHVRPRGCEMSYDWGRLQTELEQEQVLTRIRDRSREFQIVQARALTDFWMEKLSQQPLYFLSEETAAWVEPKLQELGRPFVIDDFEVTEVTKHG